MATRPLPILPQPAAPEGGLRLVAGTELIGRWDSTAYESTPYMIRRADGQLIQVSRLHLRSRPAWTGPPTSTRGRPGLAADRPGPLGRQRRPPVGDQAAARSGCWSPPARRGRRQPGGPARAGQPAARPTAAPGGHPRADPPAGDHRPAVLFWSPLVVAAWSPWPGPTLGSGSPTAPESLGGRRDHRPPGPAAGPRRHDRDRRGDPRDRPRRGDPGRRGGSRV